jgi:hypothetical protein
VAPAWLQEPLPLEETAEKFVRPALRRVFLDLCTRPVADYVGRFGFKSDLLKVCAAENLRCRRPDRRVIWA